MSIDYNLCEVAKEYWQSLDESTLIIKMKQRYGYLLQNIHCIGIALPFNPLLEVQTALSNQGFYPSVKILGADLPTPPPPILAQDPSNQSVGDVNESSDEDDEDWVAPGYNDHHDSLDEMSFLPNQSDEESYNEGY